MKKPTLWYCIVLSLAVVAFSNSSVGQMRSGKLGVGAAGSLYLFNPNLRDGLMKGGGGLSLSYSAMEHLGIRAMVGMGQLGWKDIAGYSNTTTLLSANFYLSYDIIPHGTFNPFLFAGLGGVYFDPRSDQGSDLGTNLTKFDINYLGGVGFDYFFSEFFSMTVSGEFALTNTDKLDNQNPKNLGTKESYSRINVEFRYYFFDQEYITKLIQALQARYKGK
jgi:hypothetical protein